MTDTDIAGNPLEDGIDYLPKNMEFATAVFEALVKMPCKHGHLKCHICYNTETKHKRYWQKNVEQMNQKKRERYRKLHPKAKYKQTPDFHFFETK